ncbi:hypothetical protein [Fluviispira multicolorata]|uniref:Lipoprotein n=1 Tax=Fluviispira multicolorata TaxID=2654512 RepID=A0A833JEU5_9BACT|nr:hypothetical protein [Fluviispira multicolorata]KAB8033391.1 hypothetical protein GCL57_01440 [Fluviispira multicolorata]
MKNNLFILIFFIFLFSACRKISSDNEKQYFVFQGLSNKDIILYKMTRDDKDNKVYYPLMKVNTNTKVLLPKGKYFLANECSSYEFNNESEKEEKVVLSRVSIILGNKNITNNSLDQKENVYNSYCIDPLDGKEHWFINKLSFDILPGKNSISISGRTVDLNFQAGLFSDKRIDLWPLTLSSPINTDSSKFFSLPLDLTLKEKKFVISAPVNGTLWLQAGRYQVEVNGSKQIMLIQPSSTYNIKLGVIRIGSPKNFPIEERLKAGGQPIFAYINEKVLFRLNTDYPVFPGKYRVTLEGTEIEKNVVVSEYELSSVKTQGALVMSPPCGEKYEKCRAPSRITIHMNRMPFVLMTVPSDMPFLVFDQKYEYGIEGIKGIFKNLYTSEDSVRIDKLGRIKIKWETRYTTGNTKTDFVRFESKSMNMFGKSIDIMYFKPDEIYLPEGDYWLSYFVGDQNLVLPKTRVDVSLGGGLTKEVTIPLYMEKTTENLTAEKNKENSTLTTKTTLSPIKN